MCRCAYVCLKERDRNRRFRRQERTPLGTLLPSLSKSDVPFFKQAPKTTSNRLLNSIFMVFQGFYYAPPQCRFKTWKISLFGSFQEPAVQKTSNFFTHNEENRTSGSLTIPEWEFYKTGRLQTEISAVLFPVRHGSQNSFYVLNISKLCSYPATVYAVLFK